MKHYGTKLNVKWGFVLHGFEFTKRFQFCLGIVNLVYFSQVNSSFPGGMLEEQEWKFCSEGPQFFEVH